MEKEHQVRYLANTLKLAHADGMYADAEEQCLEKVRKSIGANKTEFKKALDIIADHEIDLLQLPKLSDRVRNLEDMIEIACIDGDLHTEEKQILGKCGKLIGLSQDQLNLLLKEAKSRISITPSQCVHCGDAIGSQAKFCPSCGKPVGAETTHEVTFVNLQIVPSGITVGFAKSTAASFDNALAKAREASSFHEFKRGNKEWYGLAVAREDIHSLIPIASELGRLKNKEVYVDGQEKPWSHVFGFASCAEARLAAYKPTEYCFGLDENSRFNIWGCKRLEMDWSGWSSGWLNYGRFIKHNVFAFDKNQIAHELNNRLNEVAFCPHLRKQYISQIIQLLPDQVKVGPGQDWDYQRSYDEADPRGIMVVVTNRQDGFTYKDEFRAIGVQPRSADTARNIMITALKRAGVRDINAKQLLG